MLYKAFFSSGLGCSKHGYVEVCKWSQDRKRSPNWTANDHGMHVVPILDRKWSRPKNKKWHRRWNGVDTELVWIGIIITVERVENHMIGIARIILVGVNNELSVNDLELNFIWHWNKYCSENFLISSSRWFFSALSSGNGYLCLFSYVGKVFTYTPSVSCHVGSCCLCPCANASVAE